MSEKVFAIEFDVTTLPPEDRVAAWVQFVRSLYEVQPIERPGRALQSKSKSWIIGDLIFGHSVFDAQAMARRPEEKALQRSRPFLLVSRYLSGSSHVAHAGEVYDVGPDVFMVTDFGQECRSISTDAELIAVAVPYEAVGYSPKKCKAHYRIDLESAEGQLLDNAFKTIISRAPEMTLEEAPGAAAFFSGAVSALLRGQDGTVKNAISRTRAIRTFIDDNIFNPDLTVKRLTSEFGVSRATLYRQFEASGGLKSYINNRRLDFALRSLTFGHTQRGRISEVAKMAGYSSVSHFSRAFSKRFGLNASDVIGAFPQSKNGGTVNEFANKAWETWGRFNVDGVHS